MVKTSNNIIYLNWNEWVTGYVSLKVDTTLMGGIITTSNIENVTTPIPKAKCIDGGYDLVLDSYKTINPASNVCIRGCGNDRDCWIYRDATSVSNWGIYYRNINSEVDGLPQNSIGIIGDKILQSYINLENGNAMFAGQVSASSFSGYLYGGISGNAATASITKSKGLGGTNIDTDIIGDYSVGIHKDGYGVRPYTWSCVHHFDGTHFKSEIAIETRAADSSNGCQMAYRSKYINNSWSEWMHVANRPILEEGLGHIQIISTSNGFTVPTGGLHFVFILEQPLGSNDMYSVNDTIIGFVAGGTVLGDSGYRQAGFTYRLI